MAKVKITALPETASLQASDLLTAVANLTSSKVTVKNLANSLTQVTSSISSSYSTTSSYSSTSSFALNAGVTSIVAGSSISISPVDGKGAVTISYGGGGGAFPYTGSADITGSVNLVGTLKVTGSEYITEDIYLNNAKSVYWKDSLGSYASYLTVNPEDDLVIRAGASGPYGLKLVDGGGNVYANFWGSMSNPEFNFTGSATIKGDLTVLDNGITGSLFGTSSWARNLVGGAFPYTGSAEITGSLNVIGTSRIESSPGDSFTILSDDGVNRVLLVSSSAIAAYAKIGDIDNTFNNTYIEVDAANDSITANGNFAASSVTSNGILNVTAGGSKIIGNTVITGSLVVSGSNGAGVFSQGATLIDYITGISTSGSYMVWRAPFSCSVVAMYGYREGGGPSKVNAVRSGSSGFGLLSSADLSLTNSNTWTAFSSVQNTTFNSGDSLKLIMSGSSSNNQLAVQVDFIRKF